MRLCTKRMQLGFKKHFTLLSHKRDGSNTTRFLGFVPYLCNHVFHKEEAA